MRGLPYRVAPATANDPGAGAVSDGPTVTTGRRRGAHPAACAVPFTTSLSSTVTLHGRSAPPIRASAAARGNGRCRAMIVIPWMGMLPSPSPQVLPLIRRVRGVLLGLAILACAAFSPADRLKAGGTVRVVAAIDGDTLELEDGRRLRLAGIEAAKPPPDATGDRRWPLAEAATAALGELVRGRLVTLRGLAPTPDRHGRLIAHPVREDGLWLQGELLSRGLARVRTHPGDRALAAEMLLAESAARSVGRGIWRTRAYAVRSAADPGRLRADTDSFQVIEGRVVRADTRRDAVYLDFGPDWRHDVTARIESSDVKAFVRAGIDPAALAGQMVRLRGWVSERNGPMLDLTHPEQVERLTEPSGEPGRLAERPE